ncbi:MAG: thrombospondin type 3 repeat-containing protein [Anaerolineae bacterium]|nr:thrombospondin type 3 repeat-containing protein [Anaerolineae bacterium]
MNKKVVLRLVLLLLFIASITTVMAQQELPDADGDGIPDEFDGCPSETGLPENYGCPAGVAPPDTDGDTLPDVGESCPEIPGDPMLGGCPDTDGDQQPDPYDSCPQEVGFSQNFGCPQGVQSDRDGDGVPDRTDVCIDIAGDAALAGCTQDQVTDFDGDGVADIIDACYDTVGDAGNNGCPAGTTPDSDFDGVSDFDDACPRQTGSPDNNGCIFDADQDFLEDQYDACPDQPGDGLNNGCPAGVAPPDADGDSIPDLNDRCPNDAGAPGFDCPDSDGDFVTDLDDLCPNEQGLIELQGCVAVTELTLAANRAPLSPANAAGVTRLGQLVSGVSQVAVASNGTLAVQTYTTGLLLYDLNAATLTPQMLESMGSRMAISGNGVILIDTPYDITNGVPAIQMWDVASRTGLHYILLNDEPILAQVAISPDGSRFATSHSAITLYGPGAPDSSNAVRIWETSGGTDTASLNHDVPVTQIAFHPDGARLVVGTEQNTIVWDVNSQQPLATLDVIAFPFENTLAFTQDGSKLVVGRGDGSISVWDMNSYSLLYETAVLNQGQFGAVVSAVAFSPDGSLIAVSGGPFADGPIDVLDFQIVLLDASNGSVLVSLPDIKRAAGSMAFSPDGTMLIFPGPNSVEFWGIAQ